MRGVAYAIGERELLMRLHEQGISLSALSRQTSIRRELLSRWWKRFWEQGRVGLEPRSRRPQHSSGQLSKEIEQRILQLRERGWGPARIALTLDIGHSSVHRVLLRHGRNRLRQPVPRVFRRYEKSRPGELLHLDLKYLYRWPNSSREYAYAVVDDFSREAVTSIRSQRSSRDASTFLEQVLTILPYRIEAVMTDNDLIFSMRSSCHAQRQTHFQQSCRSLGIQHRLTQPHPPQTKTIQPGFSPASFPFGVRRLDAAFPCGTISQIPGSSRNIAPFLLPLPARRAPIRAKFSQRPRRGIIQQAGPENDQRKGPIRCARILGIYT